MHRPKFLIKAGLFWTLATLVAVHPCWAEDLDTGVFEDQVVAVVQKAAPAVVAVIDRGSTFSAVVVSDDGYVLSAGHAVRPERTYRIVFPDGRRVRARGLGVNDRVDCAMLKITDPGTWPYVELGSSASLVENQPCISISHPGRFDSQRGAVVRLGRIIDPLNSRGMIQSTAKMEPGDSGGPLLDLEGRVVGIHSNIRRTVDRNYEVPIDAFKKYWDQLKQPEEFNDVRWPALPQLGLQVQQNEAGDALEVTRVDDGQTAFRSGLKLGDEIISVASRRVTQNSRLADVFKDLATANQYRFAVRVRRNDHIENLTFDLMEGQPKPAAYKDLENLATRFAELESRLDDDVVEVESTLRGDTSTAWVTRIRADSSAGNLVGKSSEVGENPRVRWDGKTLPAQVVRRDPGQDLVLLAAELPAGGIDVSANANDVAPRLGTLLLTPDPDGEGEISVWGSIYFPAARSRESGGFLGVHIGQRGDEVFLRSVEEKLAAETAGLAAGDVVLKLNETVVQRSEDVFNFLKGSDPFERIRVVVSRDGSELEKEVVLGLRPNTSRHVADRLPGGKSVRRDGFRQVLIHDADVRPEECGGPVFDIRGQFLGINMARHSRARTYLVPRSVIRDFVNMN